MIAMLRTCTFVKYLCADVTLFYYTLYLQLNSELTSVH